MNDGFVMTADLVLASGLRGLLFLFALGLCLGCAARVPRRPGPALLGLVGAVLLLITSRRGFLFGTMTAWFQLPRIEAQPIFVRMPSFGSGVADGLFGFLALSVLAAALVWATPARQEPR
ncbi:MAG: hypothetical protein H6742_13505 [Alphaproteobacteria bacterium]|nr:hypothetical protein [Alphaproteobacteria bacterium]